MANYPPRLDRPMDFSHRELAPSGQEAIDKIKVMAHDLAKTIEAATPAGRRREIALTHLETATMFAVKSIALGD